MATNLVRFKKGLKVQRKVFDIHTHIGWMDGFKYYGLPEPVNPTMYTDNDRQSKLDIMDELGVERSVVLSNYGIPIPSQPFTLNPVVLDAVVGKSDKRLGGIWFSPMLKMKEENEKAMALAGEDNIKILKATCLLGGSWDPAQWDAETAAMWENIIATCEKYDHVMMLHTSPGGGSDVSNAIKFIYKYGKRIKIHVAHAGGGVQNYIIKIGAHGNEEPPQRCGLHRAALIGGADDRQPRVQGAGHNSFAAITPTAQNILDIVNRLAVYPGNHVHTAQPGVQLDQQDAAAPGTQLGTQQDRYGAFARAALAGADHNGLRVHMVEVLALL